MAIKIHFAEATIAALAPVLLPLRCHRCCNEIQWSLASRSSEPLRRRARPFTLYRGTIQWQCYIELFRRNPGVHVQESSWTALLMNMLPHLNGNALRRELWQNALDMAAPLEFDPACAHFLRAWIAMGVERMELTRRVTPHDLAIARANIRTFIHLMKNEAVFLGHADRLDCDALHAAHRRLERKGLLTAFTLWPFWPNEFVASG
jgi:hypothetical protein